MGNWLTDHLESLDTNQFHCVRGKASPEKVAQYCRRVNCPNLIEKQALPAKPGEMFGKKHSLEPGFNFLPESKE